MLRLVDVLSKVIQSAKMSVSKLYGRSMKMLQMVIHEDANIENKESDIKQVEEYSLPQNEEQSLDAEQILNIEKSTGTIFISNNNEVGEIQQYVGENTLPLNEVHNRGVDQAINMESCTDYRFVASQHEPANEASNLSGELIEILRGGEDKENNILNNREPSPSTPLSKNNASEEKKKLTRKRQRNPEAWKKNKKKCLKNSGMAYTTEKGKLVNAKQLKPGCGDKCRLKCTLMINEQQRLVIFNNFWILGDLNRQRDFVKNAMKEVKPKYSLHNAQSKRSINAAYHLTVDGIIIRVCKKFFMHTLDIGHSFITTVCKKTTSSGIVLEDLRGKHNKKGKLLPDFVKDGVREHINSYPTKESHYCRASSNKQYFDGDLNLCMMYRQYKEWCNKEGKPEAKQGTYENIFRTEFNIAFRVPKKDQCSLCCSYNNATTEQKQEIGKSYKDHLTEKELCREEKRIDIETCKNDKQKIICCYDLQAVLQTPAGNDSLFFYKRRLNVYNCTVYDIVNKSGHCYLCDETLGGKGCDEVGSCILQFFKEFCHGKHVIFYTDNCSAQNKNKYLLSLYYYALKMLGVKSITHKYFVVGHTQNEGDSVHATIEREKSRILKNGSVFVPSQWRTIIQCAKKKGNPYQVHDLNYSDIFDLKELIAHFGKNFTINTEGERVVWNDIKKIFMQATNPFAIYYLDTYKPDSTMKCFNVRHKMRGKPNETLVLTNKYRTRPGISNLKKKDLISLCDGNVIPSVYWDYYKTLPASSDRADDD